MAVGRAGTSRSRDATGGLLTDATHPPTLLSGQEAKERLREIVEGFFFRHRRAQGQPPARHLLVRSPPGQGKMGEPIDRTIC
jgi:hypothetical protein